MILSPLKITNNQGKLNVDQNVLKIFSLQVKNEKEKGITKTFLTKRSDFRLNISERFDIFFNILDFMETLNVSQLTHIKLKNNE